MKIILEDYNPGWKTLFETEKQILSGALVDETAIIEHIGSTSIEGLGAKPIIDILIGLQNFSRAGYLINKLTSIGYQYIDKYEDIMPYRRFFIKESNGVIIHHIHMVEIHTDFWNRHLAFRNHLRNNSDDRQRYYELKKELCKKDWRDVNEYANAKTEFIREIENKISAATNKL